MVFKPNRHLTLDEVIRVVADLRRLAKRRMSPRLNLTIFRLACCCGLRRGEISGLLLGDVNLTGPEPFLHIRAEITKADPVPTPEGQPHQRRAHERYVPLWWDSQTLADITWWYEYRTKVMGDEPDQPFVCGLSILNHRKVLPDFQIARRWRTAIRCLGPERVEQLSVHCGRHTAATLSLEAGRSMLEVQAMMGHRDPRTTSIYLHAINRNLPDVFAVRQT